MSAALEATSILTLGATGAIDGLPFTLVGRRCFRGRRGNVWNEWTLSDVPHFLSESAGSFTLYREGSLFTPGDVLPVGERVPWLVVERGTATVLAEWGEVEPGPPAYEFVDLSSVGDAPRRASMVGEQVFVGFAIDAAVLGLSIRREPPRLVPAPNVSPPSGLELWLDVGDRGALDGVEYHVVGVVSRRREEDHWQEYCLYSAGVGVRWLVVADGHWSFVAPVEPGAAPALDGGMTGAIVEWAAGELPWEVSIGEHVLQREDGAFAMEQTPDEISWSHATELATDAVAQAFGKRALPRPK